MWEPPSWGRTWRLRQHVVLPKLPKVFDGEATVHYNGKVYLQSPRLRSRATRFGNKTTTVWPRSSLRFLILLFIKLTFNLGIRQAKFKVSKPWLPEGKRCSSRVVGNLLFFTLTVRTVGTKRTTKYVPLQLAKLLHKRRGQVGRWVFFAAPARANTHTHTQPVLGSSVTASSLCSTDTKCVTAYIFRVSYYKIYI